jgi:hypothetical protein
VVLNDDTLFRISITADPLFGLFNSSTINKIFFLLMHLRLI